MHVTSFVSELYCKYLYVVEKCVLCISLVIPTITLSILILYLPTVKDFSCLYFLAFLHVASC